MKCYFFQGFRTLVEKEWLEFGHKFADRCGQSDDSNERCPVFLQWLDCVHNIVKQFPCAFQLNGNYLVSNIYHMAFTLSNRSELLVEKQNNVILLYGHIIVMKSTIILKSKILANFIITNLLI